MSSTLYNTTDGPLLIDRAGRVIGARERLEDADVESSPIAGHIAEGRLIVVDTSPADDDEQPEAADVTPTPAPPSRGRRSTTTQEG